jgi:hypothetical protein
MDKQSEEEEKEGAKGKIILVYRIYYGQTVRR